MYVDFLFFNHHSAVPDGNFTAPPPKSQGDSGGGGDSSGGNGKLIVHAPKAGEVLFLDAVVTIRWTSTVGLSTATIILDDGTTIASGLSVGDGSYSYQ